MPEIARFWPLRVEAINIEVRLAPQATAAVNLRTVFRAHEHLSVLHDGVPRVSRLRFFPHKRRSIPVRRPRADRCTLRRRAVPSTATSSVV